MNVISDLVDFENKHVHGARDEVLADSCTRIGHQLDPKHGGGQPASSLDQFIFRAIISLGFGIL